MQVSPASAQDQSMSHLFMIILSRRQPFLCCLFRAKLGFSAHKEIYRFYYFRQHIICNNTHTHARTLTHTHTHAMEDGPASPAACLRLDVRCCRQLHSSHLLWIYYLLCSSKHRFIFPRKSKRTDTHSLVLLKIRTFRDAAAHERNICSWRKSKSPSRVLMMCAQMFLPFFF